MSEAQRDVFETGMPITMYATNTGRCAEDSIQPDEIALNLGCGKVNWPGWINVDGSNHHADLICDLLALPFADGYADRAVAIHVFEHFYRWDAPKFLLEVKRVLKPGGKIVLELPCMDKVFSHIVSRWNKGEAPSETFAWLPLWGDPKYEDPAMCHRWGYFTSDMTKLLAAAGFVQIANETPNYHFPRRDMRVTARKP